MMVSTAVVPDKVNILLVDDQPGKLMSYEAVLAELGENLVAAGSAREALEQLLKIEVAIILIDVCMPELDGFQLAEMIREHPRFKHTAIIFVSAIQLTDFDRLRGYKLGAVDYVPVPVVPELLRAKVRVFADLYRKNRALASLNQELERRVAERTREVQASADRLRLAIEVARLGSWDWNIATGDVTWSDRHFTLHGYEVGEVEPSVELWRHRVHPADRARINAEIARTMATGEPFTGVYRAVIPDGSVRWCHAQAGYQMDDTGKAVRMIGVSMDITEQKMAEERHRLMVRELHHRVKNTLATVQALAGLTARSTRDIASFHQAFTSRIISLSKTHTLLVSNNWERIALVDLVESEVGSFDDGKRVRIEGPLVELPSTTALSLGLAFHELTTNAAKYGALSVAGGFIHVSWTIAEADGQRVLQLRWIEQGGPAVAVPERQGFGTVLLSRLFEHVAGATLNVDYRRDGVRFNLDLPWSEVEPTEDAAPMPGRMAQPA